jgi:hypothetical protein
MLVCLTKKQVIFFFFYFILFIFLKKESKCPCCQKAIECLSPSCLIIHKHCYEDTFGIPMIESVYQKKETSKMIFINFFRIFFKIFFIFFFSLRIL